MVIILANHPSMTDINDYTMKKITVSLCVFPVMNSGVSLGGNLNPQSIRDCIIAYCYKMLHIVSYS